MSRPDTTAGERTSLVKRLRHHGGLLCHEAADALEADASEIARLRETVEAQERELKRLRDVNAQFGDALDKASAEIHRLAAAPQERYVAAARASRSDGGSDSST